MTCTLFITILFNILLSPAIILHEFHVSNGLIEWNDETKSLEISLHVFIDDLESTLKQYGEEALKICQPEEHPLAEKRLIEYLNNSFRIEINDKACTPTFVGKEFSDDLLAVWCYFELKDIPAINRFTLNNQILLDLYDDQKNIIRLKLGEKKKGYFLFHKNNTKEILEFD